MTEPTDDAERLSQAASGLARMFTRLRIAVDANAPASLIGAYADLIAESAAKLAEVAAEVPPLTPVEMDPTLSPNSARAMQEGLLGPTGIPDTMPDDWSD